MTLSTRQFLAACLTAVLLASIPARADEPNFGEEEDRPVASAASATLFPEGTDRQALFAPTQEKGSIAWIPGRQP